MLCKINLVIFIILFLETINTLPQYYNSYQTNSIKANVPSYYQGLPNGMNKLNNIFSAASYQGYRSDSTYNSFVPIQNRPNSGVVLPLTYNTGSNTNKYLVNLNPQQPQPQPQSQSQQQLQQPYRNYFYTNNNNNPWQKINTNNQYNKLYNRYAAGTPGWFATGGNYLNNDGRSLTTYTCLLMISIFILVICK